MQGLVYRDNRLVNWDCRLKTAVSDIEVLSFLRKFVQGQLDLGVCTLSFEKIHDIWVVRMKC